MPSPHGMILRTQGWQSLWSWFPNLFHFDHDVLIIPTNKMLQVAIIIYISFCYYLSLCSLSLSLDEKLHKVRGYVFTFACISIGLAYDQVTSLPQGQSGPSHQYIVQRSRRSEIGFFWVDHGVSILENSIQTKKFQPHLQRVTFPLCSRVRFHHTLRCLLTPLVTHPWTVLPSPFLFSWGPPLKKNMFKFCLRSIDTIFHYNTPAFLGS